MRWIHAVALIVAGLAILAVGAVEVVRPASDQRERTQRIQRLDDYDSRFAEIHQRLELHAVCTETQRWDEWPCDRFDPSVRVTP